MVSPDCLRKIEQKPPPLNRPCPSICGDKNFIDNTHCSALGLPPDDPFYTQDPNFGGPGKPGYCYCCCSCFARGTALERAPGEFVLVEDVKVGEQLLVTDWGKKSGSWREGIVKTASTDIAPAKYAGMYCVVYDFTLAGGKTETRLLIVTPDHLFVDVRADGQRSLKCVQHLIPGDQLAQNDDSLAKVAFVTSGSYETTLSTIEMAGDGSSPDGHLLNANGLVTTDYTIQARHVAGKLDEKYLYGARASHLLEVGNSDYSKRFPSAARDAFLKNKAGWPRGFLPLREQLVNVPADARGFIPPDEVEQVLKNGKFQGDNRQTILQLFNALRPYHPDTIYLLDWNNDTPNVYSWAQAGQKFLLCTGGMARLSGMFGDGLALMLSSVQARLDGAACVGDADFAGVAYGLRKIWPNEHFPAHFDGAMAQATALFGLITEQPLGDPCDAPSTDCRLQTFMNGLSYLGVPACAKPIGPTFEVKRAYASPKRTEVTVTFSEPVEVTLATSADNYTFAPEVEILKAEMSSVVPDNSAVVLKVKGMSAKKAHVLTVSNVLSANGMPLDPKHASVPVKT